MRERQGGLDSEREIIGGQKMEGDQERNEQERQTLKKIKKLKERVPINLTHLQKRLNKGGKTTRGNHSVRQRERDRP